MQIPKDAGLACNKYMHTILKTCLRGQLHLKVLYRLEKLYAVTGNLRI